MRAAPFVVLGILSAATGCGSDGTPDPVPTTSGSYDGSYTVPVAPELVDAAAYPVDGVDWSVVDGIATLEYDLPRGLVGGDVEISFRGPIDPGDTTVVLTGDQGTATCDAEGTTITCFEELAGLGTLPISLAVVEDVAAIEYAGPTEDRVAVALAFGSDPIGIVTFDARLTTTSAR